MGQVPATAWLVVAEMFSFEDLDETYKKMGKDVKKNIGKYGTTLENWRVNVQKDVEKQWFPIQ